MQVQIFISIRLAGASPHVGEILRFCDFFPICMVDYAVFFSQARTHVEPVDGFSRFIAHTTWYKNSKY